MDARNTAPSARAPSQADEIFSQVQQLRELVARLEGRTGEIVERLGYSPTTDNAQTADAPRPSRGGVLGRIADGLDDTAPGFQRIIRHLELINQQV